MRYLVSVIVSSVGWGLLTPGDFPVGRFIGGWLLIVVVLWLLTDIYDAAKERSR